MNAQANTPAKKAKAHTEKSVAVSKVVSAEEKAYRAKYNKYAPKDNEEEEVEQVAMEFQSYLCDYLRARYEGVIEIGREEAVRGHLPWINRGDAMPGYVSFCVQFCTKEEKNANGEQWWYLWANFNFEVKKGIPQMKSCKIEMETYETAHKKAMAQEQ